MSDAKQGCQVQKQLTNKCANLKESHYQPDQARIWVLGRNLERSGTWSGTGGQPAGGCTRGMR